MSQDDRFAFIAEWYDPNASLFRRYELLYYPKDGSVEMYDVKNHRTFLKRTKYDDLHLEDLFVGNKVTVFSRHLSLVDYGDQYTARKLGSRKERTLALVKPDAVPKIGELVDIIINAGFTITKAKMMVLSRKEAMDLHVDHQSKPFYNELLHFITSGPAVAMEILGDDAVSEWKKLLGPANSGVARADAPGSIRAMFGTDGIRNAAHGPDSFASAARELELFFPSSGGHGPANSAKFTNCTCCIIKPHAVNEAANFSSLPTPSRRLSQIRRRKKKMRDEMFSEIMEVTRNERAHLNEWKDVVSNYRKDANEREDRRDA
ncbi:nucleoside diphosphate kinase 7 isoform X5 [Gopherus flavomarginatus]|uniref:nucleoside diphosphate kinase 7 isoform X5 n=1 Tax=Gopherus flavomarginatus TaxID=286002 RepID=UPI0021CC415D|nr:nucleoside diphosphate kinase 7 isoform X5 [Gopherus flavomarginatus]